MELTALTQRVEAWWTGRNTGPILYMIFPDQPIIERRLKQVFSRNHKKEQ